ncbi:MAG: UDP-N-acetylmuramoyl-tripeptide--D-alanyl-D-alanine ligase [Dehalococcoidia bacterium]|nr:UDP-N-acetylmuramoyl-tripeptide--D-alanyl-D-alanine ligase [Dehalococcoidia bacterium]
MTTAFVAKEMSDRGYRVIEGAVVPVTGGTADSRRVRPGDLFAAFQGEHTDGNLYVADALANGAVAAICQAPPGLVAPGKTVVVAPSTTIAAGQLAHAWRRECSPRVAGITGTVGKTTAKDLTAAALSSRFSTHCSEGNLNSREGLPLALMSLRRDHEVSVLEMGMDSPGEIVELCEIAEPEAGVVLNIGLTHVSKLGSIEAIAAEKLSLARWLPPSGTAVLNVDDPLIAAAAAGLRSRTITFGASASATLRRGEIEDLGLHGSRFPVSFAGDHATVRLRIPGVHVVPGALAALGVCIALGMSLKDSAASVESAETGGRVRVLLSDRGAIILDDRYNSSPASLAGALRLLGRLDGRRIAFIGRMAELGDYEEAEHRRAGAIAAETCDILVAVGEQCRSTVQEAKSAGLSDARWFAGKDEAAAAVRALLRPGDQVLVKASRGEAFETILPVLEGRE